MINLKTLNFIKGLQNRSKEKKLSDVLKNNIYIRKVLFFLFSLSDNRQIKSKFLYIKHFTMHHSN